MILVKKSILTGITRRREIPIDSIEYEKRIAAYKKGEHTLDELFLPMLGTTASSLDKRHLEFIKWGTIPDEWDNPSKYETPNVIKYD